MISAAIVGGTGYTGIELIRLLSAHPKVSIDLLTSRSEAGTRADEIFPSLRGISDIVFSDLGDETLATLQKCDVVFFCHAAWRCNEASRGFDSSWGKSH